MSIHLTSLHQARTRCGELSIRISHETRKDMPLPAWGSHSRHKETKLKTNKSISDSDKHYDNKITVQSRDEPITASGLPSPALGYYFINPACYC